MADKLVRPKGQTDAEESEWWYANREQLDRERESSPDRGRGRLRQPEYFREVFEANKLAKTLGLSSEEFEKVRLDADDYNLSVPEYMTKLFHAALMRDDLLRKTSETPQEQSAAA